jgi:ABC-2 type transport system permease protein
MELLLKTNTIPCLTKKEDFYKARAFNELRFDETMSNIEGMQPLVYGNQEFFQNLVDYMMGDNSVLDLRSKQIDIHAIDKEKVKTKQDFTKQ